MLARFRDMRGRSVRFGFVPMFDTWFKARTAEELMEAVREMLEKNSTGKPQN